jgi:hypothetical protein
MSTYEGEHTIFGLLSQANLTQNDVESFNCSIFSPKCFVAILIVAIVVTDSHWGFHSISLITDCDEDLIKAVIGPLEIF